MSIIGSCPHYFYFVPIILVITSYEAIFKDLYEKEKMLNQELKETEAEMETNRDFIGEE